MENEITNKPKEGTWDNMNTEEMPKLKIEAFDSPEEVVIDCDKPREIQWDDGVFYGFDVIHEGERKQFSTSAWTLLKGLKALEPIKGKRVKITKKMIKGKQQYFVEDLDVTKEEEVK